jgi:phage terminase small subunit
VNEQLQLRSDLQRRFVVEYPIDFNGTQAAIRAGYSPRSAQQHASELMLNPVIVAAIEARQRELAQAAALTVEWVLNEWRDIHSADPSEIIYLRIECCRHCHGVNHLYQWTEFEYQQAVVGALAHRCTPSHHQPCPAAQVPDGLGGFGYSPHNPPLADCPVCHGDGFSRVMVNDIRKLSGPARRLFAGIKQSKDGSVEVKFRDQDGALKSIATFLGMTIDRKQLNIIPGGGPVAAFTADELSDDQLAAIATGKLKLPLARPKTIEGVK